MRFLRWLSIRYADTENDCINKQSKLSAINSIECESHPEMISIKKNKKFIRKIGTKIFCWRWSSDKSFQPYLLLCCWLTMNQDVSCKLLCWLNCYRLSGIPVACALLNQIAKPLYFLIHRVSCAPIVFSSTIHFRYLVCCFIHISNEAIYYRHLYFYSCGIF